MVDVPFSSGPTRGRFRSAHPEVLVRGIAVRPWIIGLITGSLILSPSALIVVTRPQYWPALVCGVGLVLLAAGILGLSWLGNLWLRDTDDGLIVRTPFRFKHIADGGLTALGLVRKTWFVNGTPHGKVAHARMMVDGEQTPRNLMIRTPDGKTSPLEGWLNRIESQFRQRGFDQLERGETIQGEDWMLSATHLTVTIDGRPETLSLEQIRQVERFDERIIVWKQGDEVSWARLNPLGTGTFLLPELWNKLCAHDKLTKLSHVAPDVDEREAVEDLQSTRPIAQSLSHELGDFLFQRGGPRWVTWIASAIAILLWIIVTVGVTAACLLRAIEWIHLSWIGLASVILGAILVSAQSYQLVVYRRGMVIRSYFQTKTIRFADVTALTWSTWRMAGERQDYQGTGICFLGEANPPSADRVRFNGSYGNQDAGLDYVRNQCAAAIAQSMRQVYQSTGRLIWTKELTLTTEGVVYRYHRLYRKTEPTLLPWKGITKVDRDTLNVRFFGQKRYQAEYVGPTSQRNFEPGWIVFTEAQATANENHLKVTPRLSESEGLST